MLFLAWRRLPLRLSSSRPLLPLPPQAVRTRAKAGKTTRIRMKLIKPGIGGIPGPDGPKFAKCGNLKQGCVELQAAGYRTKNSCLIRLLKFLNRTKHHQRLVQGACTDGSNVAQNVTKTPQVRGESCSRASIS